MKKLITAALIIIIPALLFLSVWQSYRFDLLIRDVADLEQAQKEIFEKNKKIVMGIEFLKSPFRINKIANDELELEKVNPDRILRIELDGKKAGRDG